MATTSTSTPTLTAPSTGKTQDDVVLLEKRALMSRIPHEGRRSASRSRMTRSVTASTQQDSYGFSAEKEDSGRNGKAASTTSEKERQRLGPINVTGSLMKRGSVEASESRGDGEDDGGPVREYRRSAPLQRNHPSRRRNNSTSNNTKKRALQAWDSLQYYRILCGKVVNNDHVQMVIVALIAINAIMMGVGTFPFVTDNPTVSGAFDAVDTAFLIVFTIELAAQFGCRGYKLFTDGWLVFDLVVIVMSWSFASVQIIRAFRIFRALRLITRVKVMKNLVLALFSVIPRMFAIGLLLFLISYIFAVMCTELFADLYPAYTPDVDYWGRLDATFFTLFQIMTLDNWSDIVRQTMVAYPYAWLPIIVFVVVTGFVVVNLIIAVICDAISALHDDDKAKLHGNFRGPDGAGQGDDDDDDNADGDDAVSGGSLEDSSVRPALREGDVRDQLTSLEAHVEELTKMQEETMLTLQMLTSSLAEHRQRRLERQQKKQRQLQRSERRFPPYESPRATFVPAP